MSDTEWWAARDSDDWCWLVSGEPAVDEHGNWVIVGFRSLNNDRLIELACAELKPSEKRKLKSLDIVSGAVEYADQEEARG